MKKWVRWWGLIAFFCVIGAMVLFWFVLADGIVRRMVEKAGTALVGAEVDVGSADVSFSPLGITLNDIEVTDPEMPSNNRIRIGRTAFLVDSSQLLLRKVIISEMSVERVRFNVPRKRPGRVPVPPSTTVPQAAEPSFSLPSLDLPSVKTVLASEDLTSPALIDRTRADIRKTREEWSKRIEQLPDRSKIEEYRKRLRSIKDASRGGIRNIAKSASDLRDLTREMDRDIKLVRNAKRSFSNDLSRSKASAADAIRSPADDIRRIKEKYGLSAAGLQNLSRALFGGKISSWVDTSFLWYRRLSPLLSRGRGSSGSDRPAPSKALRASGVDVRFREAHPRPDFLVSLIKASVRPSSGSLDGTIQNITPDQDILGAPLTFSFSGRELKDSDRLSLDGTFDHVHPAFPDDSLRLRLQGYRAADLSLSSNKDLPVTLRQGRIDLDISARSDGTKLHAVAAVTVRNALLEASGSDGAVSSALSGALERVSRFTLKATIDGTAEDRHVSVSSDLDKVLKDAVGKLIGSKAETFEKDLQAAVQERTASPLKDLSGELGSFGALGGNIDSIDTQLSGLLKEAGQGSGGKFKIPF